MNCNANNYNNVNAANANNFNNANAANLGTMFANGQNQVVLQPIVTRRTNVVHRYFVINQPHICENETKVINHYVKRHQFIPQQLCSEECTYTEEGCGCGNNNLF